MRQLFYFLITAGMFLCLSEVEGQSIRRSTICSVGNSTTIGDFRVTSTFGQKSPACSVISGGGHIIRQGFQQPMPSQPCEFSIAAAWEEILTECGTYYAFEYQGDASIERAEFLWNFGADGYPETSEEMNPMDIAFESTGMKTILLTVNQDDCESTISFTIDVSGTAFAINPMATAPTCVGAGDGSLRLEAIGGLAPLTYLWDDGSTQSELTNLVAGDYGYTVTSADGCVHTGIGNLNDPTDGLIINADITQDDCSTSTNEGIIDLTITGNTGIVEYLWSPAATTEDLSNLASGTYTVTIVDETCTSVQMFSIDNCDTSIPGVLSPNGDGENDVWLVPGIENYPDNVLQIYNRWGSEVYTVDGYLNDWGGTNSKGELLVLGAFYYVIHLNDADNTIWSGSITIIR